MIPEETIKNRFLKLKPPPETSIMLQSQIHKMERSPNPIAFPISIQTIIFGRLMQVFPPEHFPKDFFLLL